MWTTGSATTAGTCFQPREFPQSGFDGRVRIAPGTQKIRASTGLELQVMLPVVKLQTGLGLDPFAFLATTYQ